MVENKREVLILYWAKFKQEVVFLLKPEFLPLV
jgi:hypothetical protein